MKRRKKNKRWFFVLEKYSMNCKFSETVFLQSSTKTHTLSPARLQNKLDCGAARKVDSALDLVKRWSLKKGKNLISFLCSTLRKQWLITIYPLIKDNTQTEEKEVAGRLTEWFGIFQLPLSPSTAANVHSRDVWWSIKSREFHFIWKFLSHDATPGISINFFDLTWGNFVAQTAKKSSELFFPGGLNWQS